MWTLRTAAEITREHFCRQRRPPLLPVLQRRDGSDDGRRFRQHAAAASLRFGRRWRRAHVRVPIDARAYRSRPVCARARARRARGVQFSVLGDFDANVWNLFRVLYDRIQHGLAVRHVERGDFGWRITDEHHLVGRITWDPDRAGEVPLLVIDGRPFTWDEVGRMLMSFEGFTLRAFVGDSIEVIGGPLLENEEKA